MDLSDNDGYTTILAQTQRSHRHARRQQQQQQQLQLQLQLQDHGHYAQPPRRRYPSINMPSATSTSAPSAVLPEYTAEVTSPAASDAPPTYTDVDAEDEGDEEGDDKAHPLPMTSSLSRRRSLTTTHTSASVPSRRPSSLQGKRRSSTSKSSISESNNDNNYLDSLLARSVHALELSNALLQSTMSTNTSLTSVLHSEDVLDRSLARQQRNISATLREGQQMQAAWMGEMRGVVEDVEDLFDDREHPYSVRDEYWPRAETMTSSLPSTPSSPLSSLSPRRPSTRAPLPDHSRNTSSSSGGGLRRGERPRSPPPRALTQYVSVAHSKGTTTETTANMDSIYLPSTTGLRATAHVEEFGVLSPGRAGLGPLDADDYSGRGRGMYRQDGRRAYSLQSEAQRKPYHMPVRASQSKMSSARPIPARNQESYSIASSRRAQRQQDYISPVTPALLLSPASPTFPDTLEPPRLKLPPFSASPPPRIVIERRPARTSSPQSRAALTPDSHSTNPYTHRSPPHVAWSTPDLTTASLLLHTLQQPGYRLSSRSEADSVSSRSSSSRYQHKHKHQHQQRHQHQVRQGKVQPAPYSTTFNPERYFASLEPIADSEPECTRSDLEYDRDKTVRSKGKGRVSLLLEDDEEQDQGTVRSTERDKGRTGRTFVSAQWLRKLLGTSPAPESKNDMLVVPQQPPEPLRERMTPISANPTNHRPIPKRRSASTLNVAPRFLPSPSTLPSTSTSTATASVARLKAIPPTPEEQEEEKRRAAEKRRSGLKGSRQGSATGTPVMGLTSLTPLPPSSDAASNHSISGSSTPPRVSFAVEPPRYSEERERSGESGGRRVGREKKKNRKEGEESDRDKDKDKGGWMSWFLDVSSGLPPPGTPVSGRLDERMGGRGPGGGGAFEFGL